MERVYDTIIKRHFPGSPEKDQTLFRRGSHNRRDKKISISDSLENNDASSTLVHEVTHAKQHKINEEITSGSKRYPDVLSKEIDAHIKQEEYNIKMGIPPKKGLQRGEGNEINIP